MKKKKIKELNFKLFLEKVVKPTLELTKIQMFHFSKNSTK